MKPRVQAAAAAIEKPRAQAATAAIEKPRAQAATAAKKKPRAQAATAARKKPRAQAATAAIDGTAGVDPQTDGRRLRLEAAREVVLPQLLLRHEMPLERSRVLLDLVARLLGQVPRRNGDVRGHPRREVRPRWAVVRP
jgi:hypothetical protein